MVHDFVMYHRGKYYEQLEKEGKMPKKWFKLTVYWVSGEVSHLHFAEEDFCETVEEAFRKLPKVSGCIITEEQNNDKKEG